MNINIKSFLKYIAMEYVVLMIIYVTTINPLMNNHKYASILLYLLFIILTENYTILTTTIINEEYYIYKNKVINYLLIYFTLLVIFRIVFSGNHIFNIAIAIIIILFKLKYLPSLYKEKNLKELTNKCKYIHKDIVFTGNKKFRKFYKDTKHDLFYSNYMYIRTYHKLMYIVLYFTLLLMALLFYIGFNKVNIDDIVFFLIVINLNTALFILIKLKAITQLIIEIYYEKEYGNKELINYIIELYNEKNVKENEMKV